MLAVAHPRVTVVVPVKDRRERMQRCLDALLDQDHSDFGVLVLDNCSTDGTAEAIRERAPHSRVPVRVEVVAGSVGRLRNVATELTGSEILAFTDSDCIPQRGWLSAGVAALDVDESVGVVQGKTLPEPGGTFDSWTATIDVREYTGRFESCNLILRRQALEQADGFDEGIGHFWEDTAAGWSILRAGWRPAFAADAVVYHDVTHPGFLWFLRRGQRYGNVASVIRRYPELRREILWQRYFLRPRNARTLAAVAGVFLCPVSRTTLVLALPFAWFHRPIRPTPRALKGSTEGALFDLSILVGMIRGSIRHRTLVL